MLPSSLEPFGVLGTSEDPDLRSIARLAAQICDVPSAAVNLLDDTWQHMVAAEGVERVQPEDAEQVRPLLLVFDGQNAFSDYPGKPGWLARSIAQ